MKRFFALLLAILLTLSLVACGEQPEDQSPEQEPPEESKDLLDLSVCYTTSLPSTEERTLFVQFTMQGGATFVVELYPQYAPITVENFQNLVASGFYNGTTFHRIVSGFMIQGGAANGDKRSPAPILGEFAANGFTANTIAHERGVISMARTTYPNSATSQFFVMHEKNANLDGNYAAFGRVVAGMETVDAIAALPVRPNSRGERSDPVEQPVIESAYFVSYTE